MPHIFDPNAENKPSNIEVTKVAGRSTEDLCQILRDTKQAFLISGSEDSNKMIFFFNVDNQKIVVKEISISEAQAIVDTITFAIKQMTKLG